ncbi:hypothetical protein [Streptomyces sp. NBC_00448]|uniref:hypothetical protein n=1 Tax=Streptomyces sp. NBC_00448 TaxID=2903652 RepID=UPI002E1FEC52
MAKNKNQNRPQREQHDERSNQAGENQEQHSKSALAEEHMMPSSTHAPRKQQKKFGHN